MKKPEVLDRPVHDALTKPTYIEKIEATAVNGLEPDTNTPDVTILPKKKVEVKSQPSLLRPSKFQASGLLKREQSRAKLRIIHERVPLIPKELEAPCDSCKTTACCSAYHVTLTKEEYESGLYAPHAVKIEKEHLKYLKNYITIYLQNSDAIYLLEGNLGEPCPFLKNNRCSIYDYRPITCRQYTCMDDPRIDQEVRDGTKGVDYAKRYDSTV